MKIVVEMLAFNTRNGDKFRVVELPDHDLAPFEDIEDVLNAVFYYGQNDVQPSKDFPSLSIGDVIHYTNDHKAEYYLVVPVGFYKLTEEEYEKHRKLPRLDRYDNTYRLHQKRHQFARRV